MSYIYNQGLEMMLLYLVIKHIEICLKHIRTGDRSQLATFSGNVDRCTELNKVQ